MKIVNIKTRKENLHYPIYIGQGIIDILLNYVRKIQKNRKVVLVTDVAVGNLYPALVKKIPCDLVIILPSGEKIKSREIKAQIEDTLLERKYGRDTLLIVLGGGVVGDLTGFVAATYHRGIPFVQVPTTLLSMVDASIGGKTAVNTDYGKNLIGCFHQPEMVVADVDFMETLTEEEFLNGLAEIVKTACILDKKFFERLEKEHKTILKRENMLPIIKKTIELKKNIVNADSLEKRSRQILNFGHTLGHGIETASGNLIKHGFAVSMGIAAENYISSKLGILSEEDSKRTRILLENLHLPVKIPEELETEKILKAMMNDKKNFHHEIRTVLLSRIGKAYKENNIYSFPVKEGLIREIIDRCKK